MAFDLKKLAIKESTVLQLLHPVTGDKLFIDANDDLTVVETDKPVTVTLASKSSREYREYTTAMANRRLRREQAAAKARKDAPALTVEEIRNDGLELLVVCCLDSANLEYNGKLVKTADDFRALLSDPEMEWVKDQVDSTIAASELFIAESLMH